MRITQVKVSGFRANKTINYVKLKPVNILIGRNGTGKTQFLRILNAVLSGDVSDISRLPFSSVELKYNSDGRIHTLKIFKGASKKERIGDAAKNRLPVLKIIPNIEYVFDGDSYTIISPDQTPSWLMYVEGDKQLTEKELKKKLDGIFRLVNLSVSRLEERTQKDSDKDFPYIILASDSSEKKISNVIKRISSQKIRTNVELSEISKFSEREVISQLLFQESSNEIEIPTKITKNTGLNSSEEMVIELFEEIGILNDELRGKIHNHFEEINSLPSRLSKLVKDGKSSDPEITKLILAMSAINKVVKIYSQAEEKKNAVNSGWSEFQAALKDLIPDKSFDFDENGDFSSFIGNRKILIEELSSGEKQVFVMISEAYLNRDSEHIFLADEPELSLHVEWQAKILKAIVALNPKAQYIVATHSPEIAGAYPNNITGMEEIISG